MNKFLAITKALSDQNRVRALMALRSRELCVCQIIELLELAPSTVSKHMAVLRHAGLVQSRKEERWMYYRLPDTSEMTSDIKNTLFWFFAAMEHKTTIEVDRTSLQKITRQNPVNLCKLQRNK